MLHRGMKRLQQIARWMLALLLALVFIMAGGAKLIGSSAMVQEFGQIGFGQWLRYLTGILEVSGAVGLLIPKYSFPAALQIAVVMVGATFTNVVILHLPPLAVLTGILLSLALVLAWLCRLQQITNREQQKLSASA
jgi:putative oxidoreductase